MTPALAEACVTPEVEDAEDPEVPVGFEVVLRRVAFPDDPDPEEPVTVAVELDPLP